MQLHLCSFSDIASIFLLLIDIPFDTEADLRLKGSSRTPDVLLQIPIGVQVGSEWHVVCWIDSKVGQCMFLLLSVCCTIDSLSILNET